jgi:hypothetical protein
MQLKTQELGQLMAGPGIALLSTLTSPPGMGREVAAGQLHHDSIFLAPDVECFINWSTRGASA